MKSVYLFISIIEALVGPTPKPPVNIEFDLGARKCYLQTTTNARDDRSSYHTFVALHENETTCIEAFNSFKPTFHFKLFRLQQTGDRLVRIDTNRQVQKFDPNRMFSTQGILKTLALCNTKVLRVSKSIVQVFANSILKTILPKQGKAVVALHNNTNDGYSVNSYADLIHADSIHVNKSVDVDDFFVVTNYQDFKFFRSRKQNVVLQLSKSENDGSLSAYCRENKIRYINVEAENGHLVEQANMLRLLNELLVTDLANRD